MLIATSKPAKYQTELQGAAASLTMDVAVTSGGGGNALVPFELLLSGFASCLNITIRKLLEKYDVAYRQVTVRVDEDRDSRPGTMLISWQAEIDADLTAAEKEQYIQRAFQKCPVHNALAGNIEFVAKP